MDSLPADLERIEDLRQTDPEKALELAEAVLRQAPAYSNRTRAQALCAWGGVLRTLGRWDDAETAYLCAAELMASAGVEIRDWYFWNVRVAILRRDQGNFEEARGYAERAVELCHGDGAELVVSLVTLATVHLGEQNHAEAADCAREALKRLGPRHRCYRPAAMALVMALSKTPDSDTDELFYWLGKARQPDPPGSYAAAKWTALEGLAHRRVGRFEESAAKLWTAFREFCRLTVGLDAAVCCLHIALLYLENDRPQDANRLSGELFPVFHLLRLNREATSALWIFRRAAEQDQLTVELVRDVKARLEAIPTPPFIPRGT